MTIESATQSASAEATNSLNNASSAYLRSAMHQPVQWHEWSEEAFAKAVAQDKPILLDIGAVWCHWCHVMDREILRERRGGAVINETSSPSRSIATSGRTSTPLPGAVQSMAGQGGWPLTAVPYT